jgi:hypothetical protein
MWPAGGGVKPGVTVGETDEFGYDPVADQINVHDLRANVMHLVGIDHTRLNYKFQAREWSLCLRSDRLRYRGVQTAEEQAF